MVCVESDIGTAIIPAAVHRGNDRLELLGELLFDYRDVLHQGEPEVLRQAWQQLARLRKASAGSSRRSRNSVAILERFFTLAFHNALRRSTGKTINEGTFRLAHSRLGRQMRRLQKQGVVLRRSSGTDSHVVHHLYECKRTQFAGGEDKNLFLDPRRCEFMVAAAAMEGAACEIYTLERGSSLVAGLVTFRDEEVRRFYTIYFNPEWARYSPGQALLYEVSAQSLAEGLSCDYMTGEYPYKLRLANAARALLRIDLSAGQLADVANRAPASTAA